MRLSGADFYLQPGRSLLEKGALCHKYRLGKRQRFVPRVQPGADQSTQHGTHHRPQRCGMATTLELARQIETKLKLQDSQLVRQLATVSDSLEQARQYAGLPDASGNR